MTVISPFKAIRPTRDKAYLVATRPFYTYNKTVLKAKLEHNPYTFLHVINPEFHTDDKTEPNTPERYQKVRNKFDEFLREGILMQDQKACFYLYRQTIDGHEYTGIIGGASVNEYNNGSIKKHEETLTDREEMFSHFLKIVEFNVEPVLLFHQRNEDLNKLYAFIMLDRPEYEFSSWDKGKHELWIIEEEQLIEKIETCFDKMKDIYIADGHHRCASSARHSQTLERKTSPFQDQFLACYISEDRMKIYDYNRLIKDLNELTIPAFIEQIGKSFLVTKIRNEDASPFGLHELSMYLDGQWYKLTAKEGTFDRLHPVDRLDTDILTKNILAPVLNISDLRTDNRIFFIDGRAGMEGIKEVVDEGRAKVGFGLFPVSIEHLKKVADEGLIMPPKSTWIEPKIRSGLTIFPLDAE